MAAAASSPQHTAIVQQVERYSDKVEVTGPNPVRSTRGCSSVGRAPALQAGGREFKSHHFHLVSKICTK